MWFVINPFTHLVVECEVYRSAVHYVLECGGVIVRASSTTELIINYHRALWNNNL